MHHVGRNIVIKDDAIPRHICEAFIALLEDNVELCEVNSKKDGTYGNYTQYTAFTVLTDKAHNMDRFIKKQLASSLRAYLDLFDYPSDIGDEFEPIEIMKFKKLHDKFDTHFDANGQDHYRQLVFIWYLNDVDEGGALQLPSSEQHITVKPKRGRLAIIPTDWTHYHYVEPPISNDRYSLITFLRFAE